MPNQRDKNKRQASVWLERDVLDRLDALCKELGVARAELLTDLLAEHDRRAAGDRSKIEESDRQ